MKQVAFVSTVSKAKREEVHKGWIRVSDDFRGNIPNGTYVKVAANGRSTYCQIRGVQKQNGVDVMGRVEISGFYRKHLGWLHTPSEPVAFTVKKIGLIGKLEAYRLHPDDNIRFGTGMAFLSLAIGFLGLGVSLFPPALDLSLPLTRSTDSVIGTIASVITGSALVIGPVMMFLAFRTIFGNPEADTPEE